MHPQHGLTIHNWLIKRYKIHILTILLSIWVLLLSYSPHSGCIDIFVGPLLEWILMANVLWAGPVEPVQCPVDQGKGGPRLIQEDALLLSQGKEAFYISEIFHEAGVETGPLPPTNDFVSTGSGSAILRSGTKMREKSEAETENMSFLLCNSVKTVLCGQPRLPTFRSGTYNR